MPFASHNPSRTQISMLEPFTDVGRFSWNLLFYMICFLFLRFSIHLQYSSRELKIFGWNKLLSNQILTSSAFFSSFFGRITAPTSLLVLWFSFSEKSHNWCLVFLFWEITPLMFQNQLHLFSLSTVKKKNVYSRKLKKWKIIQYPRIMHLLFSNQFLYFLSICILP
mgnify:FL=1